ncbi:MAG: T9SS type A sorting domain-containing protein [Saprospiraceae bacterium]|jgi:hypothetical protein
MKSIIFIPKFLKLNLLLTMFLLSLTVDKLKAQYQEPKFRMQFSEVEHISCNMVQVIVQIIFYGDEEGTNGENVYVAGMDIPIHAYPGGSIVRIDPATTNFTLNNILKSKSWFSTSYPGTDEEELTLSGTNPNGSCCDGDMVFVEGEVYDLCTIYMFVENEALVQFEDMVEPTVSFDYRTNSTTWVRDEFEIYSTIGDYPLEVNPISGSYNISGSILRQPNDPNMHCPDGMPLVGISIQITNPDPDVNVESVADFEGSWCFPAGYNDSHNVQPYTMGIGEPLCGVSTADILFIQRHILGLTTFDARWKKLAADANNNQSITAADIACIRKAILGLSTTEYCPDFNQVWRFETSASYIVNHSPELARFASYTDLVTTTALTGKDFYGYKVGDVDGSCDDCQTLRSEDIENRSNSDTLTLALGNPIKFGFTGNYKIPVYTKVDTNLTLLSLSISDPQSSLVGISSWYLDINSSRGDYQVQNNGASLDLMWMVDTTQSVNLPGDTLLFYIIASDSTNNFSLNSTITSKIENKWYPNTSNSGPLKLIKEIGSFGLKRQTNFVYPNPASNELKVSLKDLGTLPASLTIRNSMGHNCTKMDHIETDIVNIPVHSFLPGIYFITIKNKEKQLSQKWIKL